MSLNNSLLVLVWLSICVVYFYFVQTSHSQPTSFTIFNSPFYHHTVLLVGYVFFFLLFFFCLILLGYEVGLDSAVLLSICIAISFQRI